MLFCGVSSAWRAKNSHRNSTKNLKAPNFECATALKLKLYEQAKAVFAQGLPLPPIPLLLRTGPDGAGLLGGGPPLRGGGPLFIGRGPLEEPRRQHDSFRKRHHNAEKAP